MQQQDRLGSESGSVGESLIIFVFVSCCVKAPADCNNNTTSLESILENVLNQIDEAGYTVISG